MSMPSLEAQIEDLESVKQAALGQRDSVGEHVDHALNLIASARLAAEQLMAAHDDVSEALDTVPAFHAELPDEVEGYADLDLPPIARQLLGAFNHDRLAELQAGLDTAAGALNRYRDVVNLRYEAHHGEHIGWRPVAPLLAIADVQRADVCPVEGCDERDAHAFVTQDSTTLQWKHYEKGESSAWDPNEVAQGVDL